MYVGIQDISTFYLGIYGYSKFNIIIMGYLGILGYGILKVISEYRKNNFGI